MQHVFNVLFYRNRFQEYSAHNNTLNYKTNTGLLSIKNHQKEEKKSHKRMKSSNQQVEVFGITFGAAWKTAYH